MLLSHEECFEGEIERRVIKLGIDVPRNNWRLFAQFWLDGSFAKKKVKSMRKVV